MRAVRRQRDGHVVHLHGRQLQEAMAVERALRLGMADHYRPQQQVQQAQRALLASDPWGGNLGSTEMHAGKATFSGSGGEKAICGTARHLALPEAVGVQRKGPHFEKIQLSV